VDDTAAGARVTPQLPGRYDTSLLLNSPTPNQLSGRM
jgi:hypothetical protein